ncbi:hypothetical protein IscW_ISCW003239 [Ixodes scapularis]|uniref:Uncharacterized protein n=1 Tax=Ixodes scapularis TaxID=6945 RepID=B7PBM7_IXOSC|nr:hypothetical protein IscW_ISCW003239 [Ixodes scapularis]|eukprot:XP_002408567.1 hypothetical protein IscW_ISCW003239 [Ixodes scapularis]
MERTAPGVSWGSELDNGRRSRSNRQRRDWTAPRSSAATVNRGVRRSRRLFHRAFNLEPLVNSFSVDTGPSMVPWDQFVRTTRKRCVALNFTASAFKKSKPGRHNMKLD